MYKDKLYQVSWTPAPGQTEERVFRNEDGSDLDMLTWWTTLKNLIIANHSAIISVLDTDEAISWDDSVTNLTAKFSVVTTVKQLPQPSHVRAGDRPPVEGKFAWE